MQTLTFSVQVSDEAAAYWERLRQDGIADAILMSLLEEEADPGEPLRPNLG